MHHFGHSGFAKLVVYDWIFLNKHYVLSHHNQKIISLPYKRKLTIESNYFLTSVPAVHAGYRMHVGVA